MSVSRNTTHAVAAGLTLALLAAPGWAQEEVAPCNGRPLLTAGDRWRGENDLPGSADHLLLEVSEPGVVALAAVSPGREPLAPELVLDREVCAPAAAGPSAVIAEHTASSMLVLVRTAGTYFLRVMPRDPLLAVGPYRIESRFAAFPGSSLADLQLHSVHAADGTGDGSGEEEEDIEEVDGDPINLTTPAPAGPEAGFSTPHTASSEEEEEDIEEVDGEPVNLSTPGPGMLLSTDPAPSLFQRLWTVTGGRISLPLSALDEHARLRFFPLCGGEGADDHADLPLCATPLVPGAWVEGALGNGFGDDYDLFTFQLDSPARVRIESRGDSDTFGGLYDAHGRRLAVDDDGGSGSNFLLRAFLEPGRYFLRVEGADGAEGAYRVALRSPVR